MTEALKDKYSLNEEIDISYENKNEDIINIELKNKVYKIVEFCIWCRYAGRSSSNNSANINFSHL